MAHRSPVVYSFSGEGPDATAQPNGLSDESDEARFGRRVVVRSDGCWAYNGNLLRYGQIARSRRNGMRPEVVPAHRFAYETLRGPIPAGHVLHHRCEHPGCVNPAHLVALTPSDHSTEHARLRRIAASPPPAEVSTP